MAMRPEDSVFIKSGDGGSDGEELQGIAAGPGGGETVKAKRQVLSCTTCRKRKVKVG